MHPKVRREGDRSRDAAEGYIFHYLLFMLSLFGFCITTQHNKLNSPKHSHNSPLSPNPLTLNQPHKSNKMPPLTRVFAHVPLPSASRQAARRPFSILSRARHLARTFEPHPFERLPIAQKSAKADWGKQVRHLGDAAVL